MLGWEILASINLLFSSKFLPVYRMATLAVLVSGSQTIRTELVKDVRFSRFSHLRMCKDATFSSALDLHTCILLVGMYRFGKCLGDRFSPISTFFSLVSSCAFRYAPHSRFRCMDPNQCLPNFLKLLLLAFSEIYTRVFFLRKSINLDSA